MNPFATKSDEDLLKDIKEARMHIGNRLLPDDARRTAKEIVLMIAVELIIRHTERELSITITETSNGPSVS